jgi:NADPH:quinone reductase-like Zn-dependent oxidoreductase
VGHADPRGRLAPGETVLVLGGGGIVGQVAIQAARMLGAGRVVAAARSDGARRRAAAAGADDVVPLGRRGRRRRARRRLREACGGAADVVVDPLFGVPATAAARVLARHGRLVNLGCSAGDTATFRSSELRSKPASVIGYTNNDVPSEEKREILATVLGHAAGGRLAVAFESRPLADVAARLGRDVPGRAQALTRAVTNARPAPAPPPCGRGCDRPLAVVRRPAGGRLRRCGSTSARASLRGTL